MGTPGVPDESALLSAPLVASVETHQRLDSTNDRAKACVAEAGPLPRLIFAHEQTTGRGRGANRWWSTEGSLTFSLLLAPGDHGLTAAMAQAVSITTAVALCDQITAATPLTPTIKWPNDVYVGPQKVAGILLEAPRPDRLIVGVGVNLNNDFNTAPDEVRGRAASLAGLSGSPVVVQDFLLGLLEHLTRCIGELASSYVTLPARWNGLSALNGRRVTLAVDGDETSGECVGIDSDGALLLRTDDVTRPYATGVVAAIDPAL